MLILCLFLTARAPAVWGQDFKKQVIYQIVTDRFFNGDRSNDNCPQSDGLFDSTHTRWRLYWGGDLAGIEDKLQYLKGMGVTAIWISPPVDNIDVTIPGPAGRPMAGYHGYWARDFMRIEEHFGDCNNTWVAFDRLVSAAHRDGIKMVVDFAANHTSDRSAGEFGALYDNGKYLADYRGDPRGFFHHTPSIRDWNSPYQLQYYTLDSLADLNQENPAVDAYLRSAVRQFQQHGGDGFRLDAVKHVAWGWLYSLADAAHSFRPSFLFGEWFEKSVDDPLYRDSVKFANRSGISLLDYPLAIAIRDVFSGRAGFPKIDETVREEDRDFITPNDLVTFFDNQDLPRLLSLKGDRSALNQALAFALTCRGIPVIYYADEQYLHNDTERGGDPYNRVWMSSWSTQTRAYRLIRALAELRIMNDALAYGTTRQRWINNNVYVYERQFFNDVVLVAINKSASQGYAIDGLDTALPQGNYSDYLNGLLGGFGISVSSGSGGNSPVQPFTLPANTVSVWVSTSTATLPEVGSIGPTVGQPGMQVTIAGKGFRHPVGSVRFGAASAPITSWSNASVTFTVPNVRNGVYQVQLEDAQGDNANTIQFTVLEAKLVPVTFTVNNANPTQPGDYIYLTRNTVELGDWGTTFRTAAGPMLAPDCPTWFLNVSVPACQPIQFKFVDIQSGGHVVWENGSNHSYTVPCSGAGYVTVNWQR